MGRKEFKRNPHFQRTVPGREIRTQHSEIASAEPRQLKRTRTILTLVIPCNLVMPGTARISNCAQYRVLELQREKSNSSRIKLPTTLVVPGRDDSGSFLCFSMNDYKKQGGVSSVTSSFCLNHFDSLAMV